MLCNKPLSSCSSLLIRPSSITSLPRDEAADVCGDTGKLEWHTTIGEFGLVFPNTEILAGNYYCSPSKMIIKSRSILSVMESLLRLEKKAVMHHCTECSEMTSWTLRCFPGITTWRNMHIFFLVRATWRCCVSPIFFLELKFLWIGSSVLLAHSQPVPYRWATFRPSDLINSSIWR